MERVQKHTAGNTISMTVYVYYLTRTRILTMNEKCKKVENKHEMLLQNNEWLYLLYQGFILDYTQIVIFRCEYVWIVWNCICCTYLIIIVLRATGKISLLLLTVLPSWNKVISYLYLITIETRWLPMLLDKWLCSVFDALYIWYNFNEYVLFYLNCWINYKKKKKKKKKKTQK